MKRRILSGILSVVLMLGCLAEVPPLQTSAKTDAQAAAEDVPVTTTDVEVKDVEWKGSTSSLLSSARAASVASEARTHEIIMVLDVSGSMGGDPITEMKKACQNFIDDILNEDSTAGISIVTFAGEVTAYTYSGSYFTSDRNQLRSTISSLSAGGGTAMNAGLLKADEIIQQAATTSDPIVIQMADGLPNNGNTYTSSDARYYGTTFTDPYGVEFTYNSNSDKGYASEVYNTYKSMSGQCNIYSLGFFHSMSGTTKQFAGTFMNDIQNQAYFEVDDADLLSFSFESIAEVINTDYLVLNKSNLSLSVGSSEQLTVTFSSEYPSSADKTVTWGSDDSKIAKVSSDGVVTGVSKGECTITAQADNYQVTCPVTVTGEQIRVLPQTVQVYQNENGQEEKESDYVASEGATVTYDGVEYKTNSAGSVKIPDVDTEIQVSKEGYSTKTITAEQLENSEKVYLEKTSDNPVINAVWVEGINVLQDEYTLSLTAGKTTTLVADIDWGASSQKSIMLVQEGKETSFDGNSLSMVLSDKFDVSSDLYILAKNAAGNATKCQLQIEVDDEVPGLNDVSLSLGNSISLTLPDSWPLVGSKEVKLDVPTGTLPVQAVVEDGKVYVTIGVDVVNYTKSQNNALDKNGVRKKTPVKKETKLLAENIKDAFYTAKTKKDLKKSASKIKNIQKTYEEAMKRKKGSFAFTADFTILGFLEGTLDENNNLEFLDTGLIFNPSVGWEWSGQFSLGPVPCYWEAAIKAELQAQLNLYKSQEAKFLSNGKAEGTIEGSVGGGVGINKVATVGGGGKLTFKPLVEIYKDSEDNYFSLTTSVSAYFKVQVACFVYQYEPDALLEGTIDNSKKSKTTAKSALAASIYSEDDYEIDDLDYIDGSGGFMESAPAAAALSEDDDTVDAAEEFIFHENSYSRTSPKVVSLAENTKMAVWLDTKESDNNSVQVYYSYYDGESWSAPAVIDDDGTMDNAPDVCSDGKNAYVIWQDASEAIDENTDLETLASKMGITAAVFDPSTEVFTTTALTTGGSLDMIPTISAEDGLAAAAWVENEDNDWFGDGTNNIQTCTLADGTWGTPKTQSSVEKPVFSLAADCENQTVNTAYAVDTDGDTSTTEDQEIFVNGTQITDNEVVDSAPAFSGHSLYWVSDGALYQSDSLTAEDAVSILPDDVTLPNDQYEIVEDDENKAILYTNNDGLYSDIYGIFYDEANDAFGKPLCLTDGTSCLSAFSAIWEDDVLKMLCNDTAVTGEIAEEGTTKDPYGQTNLAWMTYTNPAGVSIEDCVYDDGNIISGSTLPITLTVKNTGTGTLSGITAEVQNESGETMSSVNIAESIASGESADYTFNYAVQAEDIGKQYTIVCSPLNKEGTTSSCELDLNYEDLAIQSLHWSKKDDSTAMISGTAANLGYSDQSDVLINLYKDYITKEDDDGETVQGTVVKSLKVDQIAAQDTQNVYFEVPYEKDAVYYVEISAKDTESNTANNSDFVYLYEETKDTGRTITSLKAEKEKTSYEVGDTLDMKDLQITAEYSDGTKSNVGSAASIDTSVVNMNEAGSYDVTILYEGAKAVITIKVTAKDGADAKTETQTDEQELSVGTETTQKGTVYKVTGTNTLEYMKPVKKKATVTIPSTVTINGVKYKVTSIAAKAFKGNKKLKKVTIPASIKKIGKQAFYGCKNLKSIVIKTKSLTKKTVGSKAFKGIYARAVIKVPKKQLKSYKKMLRARGVGKKAKIKK